MSDKDCRQTWNNREDESDYTRILLMINEQNAPLRDRLSVVETEIAGMKENVTEIRNSVKRTEDILNKHSSDEQGYWSSIRADLGSTKSLIKGIGIGLAVFAGAITALNYMGVL